MKKKVFRLFRLILGLFLFAIGVVMTLNANLGVAPWDVLHTGIAQVSNITIGRANILMGIVVVVVDIILGQPIGWGSLLNMVLVGTFIDILMINSIIPIANSLISGLIMLFIGMIINGYAAFVYLSAELGAGPRDGLMIVLTKKTNKSVRLVKGFIEILVVIVGFILGGKVGIGTVLLATFGGFFFQVAFKTVNFNVKDVNHRYIQDDIKYIKEKVKSFTV